MIHFYKRYIYITDTMSGVIGGNNIEEEYLWSCTLSGSNKEYSWAPEDAMEEDDDKDIKVKPSHRLLVKMAILMPSAKEEEVSIIQVESEGYNKQKVVVPICAMKGGQDLQKYVDLLIPGPAKLTLLQGEGPIHLAGSHCVDFFGFKDGAGESEDEDEATADEEDAEAEVAKEAGDEKSTPSKGTPTKEDSGSKKRKASADPPKSDEKKKKESPAK